MTPARSCRGGFTLLEALVASVVALIALGAALAALPQILQLGRGDGEILARAQAVAAAVDLLHAELAAAGYGAPGAELVFASARDPGAGHTLAFEVRLDRWREAPRRLEVSLSAGRDRSGAWSLYRRVDAAARQPAVAGVRSLRLTAVAAGGAWRAPPLPGSVTGEADAVELELMFVDATSGATSERIVVPLRTPLPVRAAGSS